ncbi:pilus assembly protein TadG-related protein [Kocuria sabuli]|uniref:pilus assembly protein TadG-related protein n=1 Tax=Kocuria sabuli TaxID=3071448 RepID=UPI0034D43D32
MIHRVWRETRGGISVIVALSLVVLLGAAAIVIDVGAMYAERAELQNGSDAAALAIAQNCAAGSCGSPSTTAQTFANSNAKDSAANVASIAFPTTASVRVQLSTRDGTSGAGALALSLAPLLGVDSETVSATSTAAWGSPAGGPAILPLAFAPCVFNLSGGRQVIETHGNTSGTNCTSTSPSGATLPGGFSWLSGSTGTTCSANLTINTWVPSSPGASVPSACSSILVPSLVGETVLLPIYGDKTGTGSGASYRLTGWAAFRIYGWRFPSNDMNNNTAAGPKCVGNCNGIIGEFVRFASLDEGFTLGGPNMGATVVSLTE